jgi:hypothetical protein
MSIFIENENTRLIRIGDYTYTKDRVIAIEPVTVGEEDDELEDQTYSDKLYINQEHTIDPDSPLANLINDGIIVKKQTSVSFATGKKKGKSKSKKLSVAKTKQPVYDVYEFYRHLKDNRTYDSEGNPDYDDDTAINENDCLKTAECLTIASQTRDKRLFETLLKANQSPPVLRTGITEKIFAETSEDKDNIKLLKQIELSKKNNYAAPEMGESYAIVRKRVDQNTAYHAAFVIYTHDGVNVTLEAEADAGPTYQPKFGFYDTNPNGNTFHRRWSAELYKTSSDQGHKLRYNALYKNGETIVLKSRILSDILAELEKERLYLVNKKSSSTVNGRKSIAKKANIPSRSTKKSRNNDKNKSNKTKQEIDPSYTRMTRRRLENP